MKLYAKHKSEKRMHLNYEETQQLFTPWRVFNESVISVSPGQAWEIPKVLAGKPRQTIMIDPDCDVFQEHNDLVVDHTGRLLNRGFLPLEGTDIPAARFCDLRQRVFNVIDESVDSTDWELITRMLSPGRLWPRPLWSPAAGISVSAADGRANVSIGIMIKRNTDAMSLKKYLPGIKLLCKSVFLFLRPEEQLDLLGSMGESTLKQFSRVLLDCRGSYGDLFQQCDELSIPMGLY